MNDVGATRRYGLGKAASRNAGRQLAAGDVAREGRVVMVEWPRYGPGVS